ncbi:double zinc ribbon domain-containing protein [Butyrivibrio fibrisolvens]|uniref:double zinc ribbon domain-containing protein n=1 Tax=Butyrivibrio fibrisolvens TaxID=831 RepID=UPI0003B49927|nr:zinc ribbon domain-containing protein [Butyrivibrio fibrisolvens]
MGKCHKCGKFLMPGVSFCPACGEEQKNSSIKMAGKIIKCPSCGEVLEAFSVKCPSCGYELRGTAASGAVKELADKLNKIQAKNIAVAARISKAFNSNHLSSTDNQKIETIRNFVIPNNKEDIVELMIMATSNINAAAFNTIPNNSISEDQRNSEKAISEAWIAKYDQAIYKARMLFPDDPILPDIENTYQNKMNAVKKEKNKLRNLIFGIIIAVIALIAFCLIMSLFE